MVSPPFSYIYIHWMTICQFFRAFSYYDMRSYISSWYLFWYQLKEDVHTYICNKFRWPSAPSLENISAVVDTIVDTKNIPTWRYNIQHIDKRTIENKMSIIMWEAAMSYATTFKWKNETGMKHHWVQNAVYCNKLRALLRLVFPNYISFTTSLISANRKTCAFYVNELSIGPCMCYTRRVSVILQLLASPLIKWNLPVPCKLGRERRSGKKVGKPGAYSKTGTGFSWLLNWVLRGVLWMS